MSVTSHTYKTIAALSTGLYKEKGSKFVALAVACFSENEAKKYLDAWRKEHPQARHLCYAYRFGVDKLVYRANDDGEPNHSAGTPILGQIQSFDLTNILIGVVRYFGGTKLGVGGLINAYKSAAHDAIQQGEIVECEIFLHVAIVCSYASMPAVMKLVKHHQLTVKDHQIGNDCTMQLALPLQQKDFILDYLQQLDQVEIKHLGTY